MKKLLFSLIGLIIFFLFSFNKERIILTHFGTKQWDLLKSDYKYKFSSFNHKKRFSKVGIYELDWTGKCDYYLHDKKKNKLFKYQADDVVVSNRWEYINDTTFNLNGDKYQILCFKKDSLVLLWNNPNWLDTLILVPSPVSIGIAK